MNENILNEFHKALGNYSQVTQTWAHSKNILTRSLLAVKIVFNAMYFSFLFNPEELLRH